MVIFLLRDNGLQLMGRLVAFLEEVYISIFFNKYFPVSLPTDQQKINVVCGQTRQTIFSVRTFSHGYRSLSPLVD